MSVCDNQHDEATTWLAKPNDTLTNRETNHQCDRQINQQNYYTIHFH